MSNRTKTAFITGAAKGIGRATAAALSTSGCHVILTDIDEAALNNTKADIEKSGGKASTYLLDVSNQEQVNAVHQQAVQDHSTIDYFVNNAGISGALAPLHMTPVEEWNKVIAVDLSSVFYCLQAQVKILLPQGGVVSSMLPHWRVKKASSLALLMQLQNTGLLALQKQPH